MQRARMAILLATMLIASMIVGTGIALAATPTLTVSPLDPTITVGDTTNATADIGNFTEGATDGTITIALFSDSGCSTAVDSVTQGFTPVSAAGSYGPLTTGYTTTAVGSLYWQASYDGDENNDSATSGCVEVTVAQAEPTAGTTPDPTSVDPAPADLSDTAALSGGYNATGTITFKLFPPADTTCVGTEVYSQVVNVSGDDDYSTDGTGTGSVSGNLAGTWHWTADYSGDVNNAAVSSLCAAEAVDVYVDTSVIYAGQTFDSDGGGTTTLSANLASIDPVCLSGDVTFTLTDAGGGTVGPFVVANVSPSTSVSTTQSILSGIYEVDVEFDPTNAFCNASSDFAVLSVVSPGDAANGGGWYKNGDFSPPRINFGFTVQKQYNKKTDVTTYRGQLLWMNSHTWRLKGTIFSVSPPDPAAYGTFTCPTTVGSAGPPSSNPKCGSFTGTGVLQLFDETANGGLGGWVDSTYGTVGFTVTVYDGGSISVCKGKKFCTKQDLADWFGIQIDPVAATVVPESAPIKIMNGSIKVS